MQNGVSHPALGSISEGPTAPATEDHTVELNAGYILPAGASESHVVFGRLPEWIGHLSWVD